MMKKLFKALGVAVMAMAIAFTSIPAIPVQAQDIGLPPAGYRSAGRYPAGKVENYYYYSTETRSNRKLVVYTPPGYDKTKKYPVVYSIHGIDNTPESIFRAWGADANLVADNLIGSGQIEPVIIVAWDNNNINCHNELMNNVLPYVERTFPVIKDADHRAVYGYSMGGGYAFAEVMGNLDTFHHLSPTSALPMNHPSDDAMFKKGSADVKSKLKTLILSCGTADWCGFYPANKATHDYCVRYNIPHYWLSVQGGNHDSEVWSPAMYYLLKYAFPKGSSSQTPNDTPSQNPDTGVMSGNDSMQCENMALSGKYAGTISNPFTGAVFYTNDDTATYTQQFGYDTHDFTLRGCSNNNNTAAVDLKINGEKKGTFYFKGTTPTEVTLKNIKHATGDVKVELTITTDDDTWDVYVDYLKFSTPSTASTVEPTVAPTQAPTKEPTTQEPQQPVSGKIADGWYYIKGVGSQKYLQVSNSSAQAGANVVISSGNGNDGQIWKVTNTADGYITLTSKLGNFMLDIANGSSEDGANVGIYNAYSGDAQKFVVKEVGTGIYTINTKSSNSQKVLDVEGRKITDGTNVCQYRNNGQTNQQWQFELVSGQSQQPTVEPTKAPTVAPTQTPTEIPTEIPTQEPTKEPATEEPVVSGKLDASYSINSWGSGYQVSFKITNNSSSQVNGWTLKVKKSDVKISNSWNVTVKESGDSYIITPVSWNSSIAPKGSVEFGILGDGSIGNTISCSVQ